MQLRKNMPLLFLGFLLMAAGNSATLIAQESSSVRSDLKAADANADGSVSTDEMKSFLTEKYIGAWVQKLDANRNGKISKREFRLARKALEQVLKEADETESRVEEQVAAKPPSTLVEMMNAQHLERKPLIGDIVEDVVALDESGNEVSFNDFRGKHVVLVFGCLT